VKKFWNKYVNVQVLASSALFRLKKLHPAGSSIDDDQSIVLIKGPGLCRQMVSLPETHIYIYILLKKLGFTLVGVSVLKTIGVGAQTYEVPLCNQKSGMACNSCKLISRIHTL
jgi:hypothetical protein